MNNTGMNWFEENALIMTFLGTILVFTSLFGDPAMFSHDSRVPALLFGGLLASLGGSILSWQTLERLLDSKIADED